jgi:hypothetical protein
MFTVSAGSVLVLWLRTMHKKYVKYQASSVRYRTVAQNFVRFGFTAPEGSDFQTAAIADSLRSCNKLVALVTPTRRTPSAHDQNNRG